MATLMGSLGEILKHCDSLTFRNADGDPDSPSIVVQASRLTKQGVVAGEVFIDLRLMEMFRGDDDIFAIAEIAIMLERLKENK